MESHLMKRFIINPNLAELDKQHEQKLDNLHLPLLVHLQP